MKTKTIIPTLVMLYVAFCATAQQGINYKAIINDANGDALVNTAVTVQFTILESGTAAVYQETHTPTTDANGIVIVNIGEGTVVSGVFIDIDWGSNPHFLKTEIDKGEGLTDMGTTEFKTVPYALHAETAGNAINTTGLNSGDLLMYDGNAFVSATYQFYYQDNDLDEYGDESAFVFSPIKPDGFTLIGGDCDDSDENVNPEIEEICDGIDNNCDGEIDEGCDLDQDGYSVNDGDCDDDNPNVNPGEIEFCGDEIDNDCDGEIDEDCDLDQDGYSVNDGDCNDNDPNIHPGAQEICDTYDNDCDGQIDEGLEFVMYFPDNDGDGYGYTNYGYSSCHEPYSGSFSLIGGDCNDNDANIYPGAIELCDGLDNDCDGQIDEDCEVDNDSDGFTIAEGDCDDNDASVNPGAPELCDGIDDDCDGQIDEGCGGEFGIIDGSKNLLGPIVLSSSDSYIYTLSIDFGSGDNTYTDESDLSEEARLILNEGNLSTSLSDALAYDALHRMEGAILLQTEFEVEYVDPTGKKMDMMILINDVEIGLTVSRAYSFPPGSPYPISDAQSFLEDKLTDILLSTANISLSTSMSRQILFVFAYSPEHVNSIEQAWNLIDSSVKANTILMLCTTNGEDDFLYN